MSILLFLLIYAVSGALAYRKFPLTLCLVPVLNIGLAILTVVGKRK